MATLRQKPIQSLICKILLSNMKKFRGRQSVGFRVVP